MGRQSRHSNLKIVLPAILLAMIVMRLVWMQRKDYQVRLDYRSRANLESVYRRAPGSCAFPFARFNLGLPNSQIIGKSNQLMLRPDQNYPWLHSPLWKSVLRSNCEKSRLQPKRIIQSQQLWWIGTVTLAALTVRFLSGSWLLPLITAATLMSRGSLINEIGRISPNEVIFFCVMLWLASTVHFLRTGSGISLAFSTIAGIGATLTETSLVSLLITLPLGLGLGYIIRRRLAGPIIRRFKAERRTNHKQILEPQTDDIASLSVNFIRKLFRLDELPSISADRTQSKLVERGSLLRTIELPFALWIFQKKRWARVLFLQLLTAFILITIGLLNWDPLPWNQMSLFSLSTWMHHEWILLGHPLDLHFVISLVVIILCAIQPPSEGILCFFEVAWILLISLLLTTVIGLALDYYDWQRLVDSGLLAPNDNPVRWLRGIHLLVWLEPAIIGFAIAGMFNLLKIIDINLFHQEPVEKEAPRTEV